MDTDGDGTADCNDGCPNDPNKIAPGVCGCGTPDTDTDSDGVADCNDNCPAVANADQADSDGNGVGDVCEPPPAGQPANDCGGGVCGMGTGIMTPLMLLGLGWMRRRRRGE
ncbi:MAG: thrombospondin type 3 repeat-containing protein [Phycisphaerae bacterium]